jgi:uncharacterized protein (DUF1015 family)
LRGRSCSAMARIRPFRAWRYDRPEGDISAVIAPPYDVITPAMRETLACRDEANVVAIELPEGSEDPSSPDSRYRHAAETFRQWREDGTLGRDERPAVYLLEQRYREAGRDVRRRAFLCEVGIEPFDVGVVLAHERTLPKALGDRFELINASAANFSPVFGLFADEPDVSGSLFERTVATTEPIAWAEEDGGVSTKLWAMTQPEAVAAFVGVLHEDRVFIADGHHRYTTMLAYRDRRRAQHGPDPHVGPHVGPESERRVIDPDYDFALMALVNMDDPELVVLPYHRVAEVPGGFDAEAFATALSEQFDVRVLTPADDLEATLLDSETPAFGVLIDGRAPWVVSVKPDVDLDSAISSKHSRAWKQVDTAVLQELVLDDILGIHPDRPETLERMSFLKGMDALRAAVDSTHVAFAMRATSLDQLRAVALSGETMPQKSTYFYPKVPAGFVLRSIDDPE